MNKRLEKIENEIRSNELMSETTLMLTIAAIETYFMTYNADLLLDIIKELKDTYKQIEEIKTTLELDEDLESNADDVLVRYKNVIKCLQNLLN